ncbi:flagellar assembly protein FliW [Clostridium hydrogenum]|uniref:flagellar assembly protein FliW n=1 Tax=Clostridium hydrogenum TaxID=2855764 RepID=UPI001F3D14FB|nr:flagellar assembly protein FliW [Clostridium hydrogenum]
MKLYTKYHGTKEYDEKDVIDFPKGLPGFKDLKKFIIFPIEENNVFSMLHSIENLEIGLVVVSPFYAMKEYEFNLEEHIINELKVEKEEDIVVLSTVCFNNNIKKVTTNLKAPIIINIKQKIGEQLILDDAKYSIKYPLLKEE